MFLAALLHDIVEDTDLPLPYLGAAFGERVMDLVHGLSNIDSHLRGITLNKIALYGRLMKDPQVMMIKLCDRLHNMLTIGGKPLHKQKITAQETQDFYIPQAKQLGIASLQHALEKEIEIVEAREG